MEAILSQAAPSLRAAIPSLAVACLFLLALPPAAVILRKRPWGKALSRKPLLPGAAGLYRRIPAQKRA